MSSQRQLFLIAGLQITLSASALAAAESSARLMTVPDRIAGAGSCADASLSRISFASKGGDSVTCDYIKDGANFSFKACSDKNVNKGDVVIGEAASSSTVLNEVLVPREVVTYAISWNWIWETRFILGLKCGQIPIWTPFFRPVVTIVWERRFVPKCAGADGLVSKVGNDLFNNAKPVCGGISKANTHLLGDVTCNTDSWATLQWYANRATFYGRKHKLNLQGNTKNNKLGVFAMGDHLTVDSLSVLGVPFGTAFQAYNTDALVVKNSAFRNANIGFEMYTDAIDASMVEFTGNDFSYNSNIGLKFTSDNDRRVDDPHIQLNTMNNNGNYAAWYDVDSIGIDGKYRKNDYSRSRNGIMLMHGDAWVDNMDMSNSGIVGTQIFLNGVTNVTIENSNFSYNTPATPSQERVALHLYRVENALIRNVSVLAGDVGVKLATDRGTHSNVMITNNLLKNEVVAGIMIQSYDGTAFGTFKVENNDLRNNAGGSRAVYVVPGAIFAPGSTYSGNKQ